MPDGIKAIYTKALSALNIGIPLYQPTDVRLGDVGLINRKDGTFVKLYNIARPPEGGPLPLGLKVWEHVEGPWDPIHVSK